MTFPDPPPVLRDQVADNGVWRASAAPGARTGAMTWDPANPDDGPDALKTRLLDQVHDTGTWVAGTHASMNWTPTQPPTPTSEETP